MLHSQRKPDHIVNLQHVKALTLNEPGGPAGANPNGGGGAYPGGPDGGALAAPPPQVRRAWRPLHLSQGSAWAPRCDSCPRRACGLASSS